MIVSPRGTSGSGKTTLARLVLNGEGVFEPPVPIHIPNRKNPISYLRRPLPGSTRRPILILGSYESATGGVDTISGNDIPFQLARKYDAVGYDTFMEGLLLSAEQHRTAALREDGLDVRLFYFTIPLEECLAGVRSRREARGNTTPLNPETTASRHRSIRTHPDRFRAKGLDVTTGTRADGINWLYSLGLISDLTAGAALRDLERIAS